MINNKFLKILFATIFFLNSFYLSYAATSTDGVDVDLNVNNCNNDSICNPLYENSLSCPGDCVPVCNNNNICEVGEDSLGCSNDCPPPVCNNNGICGAGEDNLNCPADCPVVPPTPSKGSSGSIAVGSFFNDLTIDVKQNSAVIKWKSTIPTMATVKWGTTGEYKSGVIKNINFLSDHKIEINNLKEGTVYYFSIQSEDTFKRMRLLDNQSFKTQNPLDNTPPGNPFDVFARTSSSGVTVSWKNPTDEDFDYIRIVKNTDRFYGNPFSGHLVYEGKGNYFMDSDVENNKMYYYSLFSRDFAGNYSSGSMIGTLYKKVFSESDPIIVPNKPTIEEPLVSSLNSYIVIQGSVNRDFKLGNTISLNNREPIILKVNYAPKDENDDVWVEISNSLRETVGQYFFTKSVDGEGYISSQIPSFEEGGYYRVAVYRYINDYPQIMNQGAFQINESFVKNEGNGTQYFFIFLIIFILLFVLLLIIFLSRLLKKTR